jgi:hypothetical protein
LLGAASLGVCTLAAGPAVPSRDYISRLDGTPATAAGLDGRSWSVWSYRATGEFDIAVAVRAADGTWSPATFLGRRDGIDQLEPSIAVDADGNVYVAFATRSPQRIWTSVLPSGQSTWSEPSAVTVDEAATAPALRVVRDRLVVAFRTLRGVRVIDLPVYAAPNSADGIQDGPDTSGPLGNGGRELPTGGDDTPPPPSEDDESSNH